MDAAVKVLIAEDDSLVADVLEHELRTLGMQVMGRASDGRQALEMTGRLRPDVVLMDVQMPEMNGFDAARAIQDQCPTPVVILTVYSGLEQTTKAADAGVGAYLVKPASAEDLDRAITIARARFADLTELRRMNRELREALENVKTLSGLLPICTTCKKIRDDKGYWRQVESYIHEHAAVEFSHGICPDCMVRVYPPDEYPYLYDDDKGASQS